MAGAVAGGPQSTRPRADEIYDRVRRDAELELDRSNSGLALSGLFAGFTLGASALVYATTLVLLGAGASFVAALVYPVGYLGAILGRAQLFTENTLYPVMASFADRSLLRGTARLWAIVLAANLAGAVLFALIAVKTSALPAGVAEEIRRLGDEAVSRSFWTTFWSAVLTGWLLALVAWLVEAADAAVGVVLVVVALTFVVGLAKLDHSIATAVEAWGAVLRGDTGFWPALGWQATTVLGNAAGGVFIVSALNYGQVRSGEHQR